MGATQPTDYAIGPASMTFSAPGIELEGVKPRLLNNAGLMLLVLKDAAGEEVIQISAVTQIVRWPAADAPLAFTYANQANASAQRPSTVVL